MPHSCMYELRLNYIYILSLFHFYLKGFRTQVTRIHVKAVTTELISTADELQLLTAIGIKVTRTSVVNSS